MSPKVSSESVVRKIKRKTRRQYSSEEKIRIVLDGLRGEESIAAVCRREGISPNLYYRWSKDFLEAGRRRFQGDTAREANSVEVNGLRQENDQLKQLVAELSLKNRVLKKCSSGMELDQRVNELVCIVALVDHVHPPPNEYTSGPLTQKYLHAQVCVR